MNSQLLKENLFEDHKKIFNGVSLEIKNLCIISPQQNSKQKKFILKGISTRFEKGSFTAIMGSSGSGKTTLLNYISSRTYKQSSFENHAQLYINNNEVDSIDQFSNLIGFVEQEEILDNDLTPRKIFDYYYTLRWNKNDNYKSRKNDKKQKIDLLLKSLKIQHCADVKIGSVYETGLSGGELKRVSIGTQLIQNPILLFLDEATTGLDSSTALEIIKLLKRLSQQGVTVITSLHQPQQRIIDYFDKILILQNGVLMFDGKPSEISKRLFSLNIKRNKNQSAIDQFMENIQLDKQKILIEKLKNTNEIQINQEKELLRQYSNTSNKLFKVQRQNTLNSIQSLDNFDDDNIDLKTLCQENNQQRSFLFQLYYMTLSFFIYQFLNLSNLITRWVLIIFVTLMIYLVFQDIPLIEVNPITSFMTKSSFYYMFQSQVVILASNFGTTLITPKKKLFLKDMESKLYNKAVFILSIFISNFPMIILIQSISGVFYFWILNLNNENIENFYYYYLIYIIGGTLHGLSLGFFIGILAQTRKQANLFLSIVGMPFFITCGFYSQMEGNILKYFAKINCLKYLYQGALLNEFRNRQTYIDNCPLPKAFQQRCDPLSYFSFDYNDILSNVKFQFIIISVEYLIVLILFFKKYQYKTAKKITDKTILYQINDFKIQLIIKNYFTNFILKFLNLFKFFQQNIIYDFHFDFR